MTSFADPAGLARVEDRLVRCGCRATGPHLRHAAEEIIELAIGAARLPDYHEHISALGQARYLSERDALLTPMVRDLRRALDYYADPDNWDGWAPIHIDAFTGKIAERDCGRVARDTLERYRGLII